MHERMSLLLLSWLLERARGVTQVFVEKVEARSEGCRLRDLEIALGVVLLSGKLITKSVLEGRSILSGIRETLVV